MRPIDPIAYDVAVQLLDFRGASVSVSPSMAEEQLKGAVALHNLLAQHGCAYLADEVGMGKTYVALGVVGLLRYLQPDLRVLYIAPRENIQRKWKKEHDNFVSQNWKPRDGRVRSVTGGSATRVCHCDSLADWAQQAVRDPNRDFLLRLTSFSFPLARGGERWREKRDELRELAPALSDISLDLYDKERFKATYARAMNTLLPHYDLVIVDEGHNLKHGRASKAARNLALARVLGTDTEAGASIPNYGRRFDRLLLLSATPLETDFRELWNQLDLFGFGALCPELRDGGLSLDDRRAAAGRLMVRRITNLTIGGEAHTKNMYRREWRGGGTDVYDTALEIPSDRQRLIVALTQKKVAELLKSPKFGASFQMGMLASFESFLETAKVRLSDDEQSSFDDAQQTEDVDEKEGIDTNAVNRLSRSYLKTFGEPMPHPKMDAVVQSLAPRFQTGEKTLVFVRRVKSVPELMAKLGREYDAWLLPRLRQSLPAEVLAAFDKIVAAYEAEKREATLAQEIRQRERELEQATTRLTVEEDEEHVLVSAMHANDDDDGGNETFFSWFFRGDGPPGWFSGAAFRKNRLQSVGSYLSTFFEDNHVLDILGYPDEPVAAAATACGMTLAHFRTELRGFAWQAFTHVSKAKRPPRLPVFRAYQQAALVLLGEHSKEYGELARQTLAEVYPGAPHAALKDPDKAFPEPEEPLGERTFFSELRFRPELRAVLWPEPGQEGARERIREREVRRELLASVARLGHAFIDLWVLAVERAGSLHLRTVDRSEEQTSRFARRFLDLLEQQRTDPTAFSAYSELAAVGQHHDLIMRVNFPEARGRPIRALAELFGNVLGSQMPVAGMYGGVAPRLVRQFRMPGYPFVLVTTDVLQEGEDLHTFCSNVIHYGISWTPSSMEQRTGRVDRIASQVHRRLDGLKRPAEGHEKLQVYFPYLKDTVEVLQVGRVFDRMNSFLRAVHANATWSDRDSKVDANYEFARQRRAFEAFDGRLESAFPVRPDQLRGAKPPLGQGEQEADALLAHFGELVQQLKTRVRLQEAPSAADYAFYGTVFLADGKVLEARDQRPVEECRCQPFAMYLKPSSTSGMTLLHVTSPVGDWSEDVLTAYEILELQSALPGLKLCETEEDHSEYTLTAEGDIVFSPELTQFEEVEDLLRRAALGADWVERRLFEEYDARFDEFAKDLRKEADLVTG